MDAGAKRSIGFWDLVLYATAMTLAVRWLATAAAAGPASLPIWALAALLFMGPLVIASAELSGRFAGEGAIYAWTRETMGPFAGFVCAWLYWTCNLPFFSGVFYFVANVIAVMAGPQAAALLETPAGFLSVSIGLAVLVALMHLAGLGVGKWLPSFGAISTCVLFLTLIGAGLVLAARGGSATDFTHADYLPPLDANGAILWATMVFAFGGAEGAAMLRNEVRGGMKQIVRALLLVGALLSLAYIAGSAAMLAIMPADEATRLSGIPDALRVSFDRLGLSAWTPFALGLLAVAMLGSLSAWFGVAARLPFAVGVDRMLPAAFARRDPKTGAPTSAILLQAGLVILLLLLSQAGETLQSAYDFLVAMSVLSYTLPFLFLFAAYWIVQDRPAPPGAWAPPGGPRAARAIAATGFLIAFSAIVCSLTPSPDAPDKLAAVLKLVGASAVLVAAGAAVYLAARWRAGKTKAQSHA
jgi:glutamate:GABA antiporter